MVAPPQLSILNFQFSIKKDGTAQLSILNFQFSINKDGTALILNSQFSILN